MRAINAIIKEMAMELCFLRMEGIMKENGKMIKWMVLVNYTMKMGKLLMKVIGKMTNLMDKVEFITHSHVYLKDNLIIKTFLSLELDGSTIKDYSKMIRSMAKVI